MFNYWNLIVYFVVSFFVAGVVHLLITSALGQSNYFSAIIVLPLLLNLIPASLVASKNSNFDKRPPGGNHNDKRTWRMIDARRIAYMFLIETALIPMSFFSIHHFSERKFLLCVIFGLIAITLSSLIFVCFKKVTPRLDNR